jgi:hypothetical protein
MSLQAVHGATEIDTKLFENYFLKIFTTTAGITDTGRQSVRDILFAH